MIFQPKKKKKSMESTTHLHSIASYYNLQLVISIAPPNLIDNLSEASVFSLSCNLEKIELLILYC